ncbi:hypothetical protein [Biformimicrobium ophioploci]|nr:hypothetical protein [Microbulbifer sp. NKW57]
MSLDPLRAPRLTLLLLALAGLTSCGLTQGPPGTLTLRVQEDPAACGLGAANSKLLKFDDLFEYTDDPQQPFDEKRSLPDKYDVIAYVWGKEPCTSEVPCDKGHYFWLIERGPEPGEESIWAVTPQYPRITVQSSCTSQLKSGKRFRFSFEGDKLIGFSPH